MACQRYYELISARLDGELSDGEERELEAHLKDCPGCRALAEQLSGLHEEFSALEEFSAPDGFVRGVMDQVRAQEQKRNKVIPLFRRPQFKAVAGLAACLALCAGLYGAGQLNLAGQSASPELTGSAVPQGELQTAAVQPQEGDEGAAAGETETVEPGVAEYSVPFEQGNGDQAQAEVMPRAYGADWPGGEAEPLQEQPQGKLTQSQGVAEGSGSENSLQSGENSLQSSPEPVTDDETDAPGFGLGVGTVSVVSAASAFSNEQYLPVTYGATPQAPSAVILGSVQSLTDYLAAFPQDDLSEAVEPYDESYFESGRLLAVVAETGSGSNRFELTQDGLTLEQVTLTEICPQEGTDDMAAWLILAQVGMEFKDGAELEVSVVQE